MILQRFHAVIRLVCKYSRHGRHAITCIDSAIKCQSSHRMAFFGVIPAFVAHYFFVCGHLLSSRLVVNLKCNCVENILPSVHLLSLLIVEKGLKFDIMFCVR